MDGHYFPPVQPAKNAQIKAYRGAPEENENGAATRQLTDEQFQKSAWMLMHNSGIVT